MPAGDVFGLDGFFLNKSNPVVVSTIGINSTAAGAGITVTAGTFSVTAGIATLTLAAGLSTTPFYIGAKIAVSALGAGIDTYPGYNGTFVVTGFTGTTTVSYASTGYVGDVPVSITGQTGRVVLVTDTQVTNTTWSSAQTHGWFGGGYGSPGTPVPGYLSTVDRIDFSNDTGTANTRSPLSLEKSAAAATGNSNYGWFGGGKTSPSSDTDRVDRIDFSNDSGTTNIRGPLSSQRHTTTPIGNSNYGWYIAGIAAGIVRSTVDRIDFSNDSATALTRNLLAGITYSAAATGNSNYGWLGAGSPVRSTVERIDFSNDSVLTLRGPLSQTKRYLAATGNSNYGWFGGGTVFPANATTSRVDRIDFSNDLTAAPVRGPLTLARERLSATGNSNYGWFGGGFNPSAPTIKSTVDRIDFSNDSATASVRGSLSVGRYSIGATSGQARSSSIRLQKGGNFGWFGGGYSPTALASVTVIDRIDFSNDTPTATVRGSLTLARTSISATGNSNYGWFGGGFASSIPGATNRVDRLDFSNDSSNTLSRGPLSLPRFLTAATGNTNYGWYGGGYLGVPATFYSLVDRIDFSNDLSTLSSRGNRLNSSKREAGATGNSNYGWFGGGFTGSSTSTATVDRINFSNDLATTSPRGPLSLQRNISATGNSNYGWFAGGSTGPIYVNVVDRIDFVNDSVQALVRGPLSLTAYGRGATGNSNYGWFGGGFNGLVPAYYSRVDRIDFSNDLATISQRGSLTPPGGRGPIAATSNSTR
jgi:hypothetical protein